MTYEVTGRIARITFNRPEKGNAIVAATPVELAACVERADLDPDVHVILVSGRGEGFCAGFDLSAYADGSGDAGGEDRAGTVLDAATQAVNHLPDKPWDPMVDYQMMSRFVRGFASLPTTVVARGRDYSDVSPVRGVLRTSGAQQSAQSVDVLPIAGRDALSTG